MIVVKLREAMEAYRRRTGERMTYSKLSEETGISESTLAKIGSVPGYCPSVDTIDKLCTALGVTPGELLIQIPDPPKSKKASRKKTGA